MVVSVRSVWRVSQSDKDNSESRQRTLIDMKNNTMFFNFSFPCILLIISIGTSTQTAALSMPPLDKASSTKSYQKEGGSKQHTSNFQAKQNHPTSYDDSPAFKGPIILGRSSPTSDCHTRLYYYYNENNIRLSKQKALNPRSQTSVILHTIVDHLAYRNAPLDVKEICESVEFYLRTRKRMFGAVKKKQSRITGEQNPTNRSINVLECCAGHGLTGMLFVACNPGANVHTTLVDSVEPSSHRILKQLLVEVCPWVDKRVTFTPISLESYHETQMSQHNETSNALQVVVATHACGTLTDSVLEIGARIGASGIAVMPCRYTGTSKGAPYGIKRALGVAWAADIRRSFFLTEKGYHSDFAAIPSEITPMNRILVGELGC